MMAFQDLKASPFGDLLNNPSGWTAKGGQPGDARGIVPAHVKGSTPEGRTPDSTQAGIQPSAPDDTSTGSTPDGTQAEAPDGRTPENTPGSTPENASGGTQVEMPEERTPDSTPDKASEEGAAGLAGPVDSTPDAPMDTADSTPPDKPQAEGAKEAPDTPETADVPESPGDKPDGTPDRAQETPSVTDSPAGGAPDETDGTLAKAPEASRIPDRAAVRERLLKELEDRPELADAFLKMFSLMPEAPGAKKAAPSVPKTEAPAPPEEADPADSETASPVVPDQSGTASDAVEEAAPSPENTPETPAASQEAPSPETTPETADPVPEPSAPEDPDPGPEALPAEEVKAPAEDVQRPSDGVSDSSKVITPTGDEKSVTGESTKSSDLSQAIDAAIRKSLMDIFASRHKDPAPAPVDATPSLPDSDDPLQILSAAMEPVEQARAAKEEETKVDQLLTLEQLTRNELIAMEAVLKELRTLARRQEVHLSLNRGAVKNGLTEVRQNLSDFREFLSTKSEPAEEDEEAAETPAEVSLADLADKIDYIRQALLVLKEDASSVKPLEPLPDAKALKASYDETLEQMAHIPNELDEGIQKVLGNAQRQVDRYCTKFLSVHKKEDTPLRKALPFIAAFLGGFLGALVVGQALFH